MQAQILRELRKVNSRIGKIEEEQARMFAWSAQAGGDEEEEEEEPQQGGPQSADPTATTQGEPSVGANTKAAASPADPSALDLLAQSTPSRSNVKLERLNVTIGDVNNPHKLSDWLTSLRDYASARFTFCGESVAEKAIGVA